VAVHEFRPDAGTAERGSVLVLHGWRSRTEFMRAVIEGHRQAGFRVYSPDLPGHGASSGRHLNMLTALETVRMCGEWFGPFESVVGHSFGGAVAVNAVAGSVEAIPALAAARLVTIAAPNAISDVLDGFGRQINLGARSRDALAARIEKLTGRTVADFTGARLLAGLSMPTLIVHAPDDREVPAGDAEAYAAAGGHVRLLWAPGLGHRRILSDAAVIRAVVDFAVDDLRGFDREREIRLTA
jgi:pimeloyl-ACP methyl ester carboxylesterase